MVEIPTDHPPVIPLDDLIKDPFNTIYDVTDKTPVDKIPEDYYKLIKPKLLTEKQELELLTEEMQKLSVDPNIEQHLIEQAHKSIS